MKIVQLTPSPFRTVMYHGLDIVLLRGERYIAVDVNGDMWAYYEEPVLRPMEIERGQWGVERGDRLPRQIGRVDLGDLDWHSTIVDCGADANIAS